MTITTTTTSDRAVVLILASDPAFAREITAHWPEGPAPHSAAPEFIVLDRAFSRQVKAGNYDLAIADASCAGEGKSKNRNKDRRQPLSQSLSRSLKKGLQQSLAAAGKPAIVVHSSASGGFCNLHGNIIALRRAPGIWPKLAGLIGREILCRHQAEARAREADAACIAAQAEATLGRYMVEMRANVNNALTTVLGNAELLVLEPGLPGSVRVQADTIRNMALRLHEVFQRFSSIEKELILTVAAGETGKNAARAAAGR
ncbi:MAG: hypothetical protein ACLPLR_02185 [Terriglobales bacterium]